MATQVVVLSSPVSAVYARNAWDHDHPFSDKERKPELQINQGLIN